MNIRFKEVWNAVIAAESVYPTPESVVFSCGLYGYELRFGSYRACVNNGFFAGLSDIINSVIVASVTKYNVSNETEVCSECFYGVKAVLLQFQTSRGMCKY